MNSVLYLVIPCYNEQEVIYETDKRLTEKLDSLILSGKCSPESRIMYVDDGSRDNTWSIITDLHNKGKYSCGIKLAHNRGHQNAVFAGLMTVKDFCDCAISMDADLQDDVNVIDGFMDAFHEGNEIVYGVRSSRETDSAFKRTTAEGYYKSMKILGVDLVFNHADCRLMSKRALEILSQYKETNLFLRGIVPSIGLKNTVVYYERNERFAGESKYPLSKMLKLAWDGITSFSSAPLKLIGTVGFVTGFLSIAVLILALVAAITGFMPSLFLGLVGFMGFFTSLVLIAIGIVASYIGKIYLQVKGRPRYNIEEFLR